MKTYYELNAYEEEFTVYGVAHFDFNTNQWTLSNVTVTSGHVPEDCSAEDALFNQLDLEIDLEVNRSENL